MTVVLEFALAYRPGLFVVVFFFFVVFLFFFHFQFDQIPFCEVVNSSVFFLHFVRYLFKGNGH